MNDEWIIKCGVRFWGERQLTEAIWTGYAGSVFFAVIVVAFVVGGVMMIIRSDGWTERLLAALVAFLPLILIIPVVSLWSDATCYRS